MKQDEEKSLYIEESHVEVTITTDRDYPSIWYS
jgi:hypothetical protein